MTQISPTPTGLAYTSAGANDLTAQWNATVPTRDSYTFQVSTAASFTGAISSSNTALTNATAIGLLVNTTYYGRVNSIIYGSSSRSEERRVRKTLTSTPATVASTWNMVGMTSVTVSRT